MARGRRPNQANNANDVNAQPQNGVDGNLVQTLIATLQGFMQHQTQNAQNVPNNAPAPVTTHHVIEQFRRYAPPRFNGRSGPLALEEWIRELERIFKHIECTDAHKVSCAVFQLVEDAGHWWESHENGMTEAERQGLTWERFKEITMEKYFPRSYRNQMQTEFLNLKQGMMTVIEYERRFNKLARFATQLIGTEEDKVDRFLRGLKSEIRGILAGQEILNYGLAVKRAHEVEAGLEEEKIVRKPEYSEKRKWNDENQGSGNFSGKKERNDTRPAPASARGPMCPQCRRPHFGKCHNRPIICFNCQVSGHYASDCPKRKGNGQRQGGQARLYAFTQNKAGEGNGNMTGMVNISRFRVLALFDSGASHFLISARLCAKVGLMVGVEKLSP